MSVEGVGTDKEVNADKAEEIKEKVLEVKDAFSDIEVLAGPCREYTIGDKKFSQKPLVMRDFGRLFEHLIEMLSIAVAVNPDLLKSGKFEVDTDNLSPAFLIGMAQGSKEMMEKVYDIITLLLNADRDFLLDNLNISQFTRILADVIELNDLREIIANFSRMGRQVREYLQKSKT